MRDWLLKAAMHGKQRMVENPAIARSMQWGRPHLEQFCEFSGYHCQNENYCGDHVALSDGFIMGFIYPDVPVPQR